jgi:hypothetical protein
MEMIISFKDNVLKHNGDDGAYLKYRKDIKKFYDNETVEYLKSEKSRIEVRYEDRNQNNIYSSLSFIVALFSLLYSIFKLDENFGAWFGYVILYSVIGLSIGALLYHIKLCKELIQCTIALQVLDELIAEKEESKTVNGAKQYNVTIVSK